MTDPLILGLTGLAGTGKTSAAEHLCDRYGFVAASFAAPMKNMLEAMLSDAGIDHAWLHEPHLKGRTIPELGVTPRHLMQTLGTEWGRACMGTGWWLLLLERTLGLGAGMTPVHDRIVISDVRFPNEADFVRRRGGRIVRLHRDQAGAAMPHESEQHIARIGADLDLVNDGPTLTGLHALLDGAMATWGIDQREPMLPGVGG